jgi:hypothetical protein
MNCRRPWRARVGWRSHAVGQMVGRLGAEDITTFVAARSDEAEVPRPG